MATTTLAPGFSRNSLLQKVLDTCIAIQHTQQWQQAITHLNQSAKLGSNWTPIIQNVETTPNGQYRVQFINMQKLDETRWLDTDSPIFHTFKNFLNQQYHDIGKIFQIDSTTGQITQKHGVSFTDDVTSPGINSGDMVKTIIDWVSSGELYDKSNNPDLDAAVGAQSYLNLVQYTQGIASEAAGVISEVLPALRNGGQVAQEVSESLVKTVVTTAATEGLAAVLGREP
ncbi:MAG: hypothetical protein ETSY1_45090 [Candidatus Entotheonella factor]|uniref:TcdA/TcdB toxin pore forming domain-containing protein n=1 Tax=Entotheonella factor TaxID=1429438 RepID=W4L2H3_ENTF1|nr:MAG: hypothetical protein ETSY1_45090 [Candidatus Entotheonella factor]